MKRFAGMMPSNEVTILKNFRDKYGLTVTIEAGPNGWSVLFADGSSRYKDEVDTPENNFKKAYDVATTYLELAEENVKAVAPGDTIEESCEACEVCEEREE